MAALRNSLALLALLTLAGCGSAVAHPALAAVVTGVGVELAWTDADTAAVSYNVYRLDGSGAPVKVNNSTIAAKWYTDDSVAHGTTYTYQVTAVDASGVESDPSGQATVMVP